MAEASKRYGHGRWNRGQVFAIVATYWRRGEDPEWIAKKLGMGRKQVDQICAYLEWQEEIELLVEDDDEHVEGLLQAHPLAS